MLGAMINGYIGRGWRLIALSSRMLRASGEERPAGGQEQVPPELVDAVRPRAIPASEEQSMPHEPVSAEDGSPANATGTQTLERGLDLLEQAVFEPMRMIDLGQRVGLSRSTTARLVARLVERGYLAHDAAGQLRGGSKLMQLGAIARDGTDLVSIAKPHLQALTARAGFSTFVGERHGDYSVHLHCTPGSQRIMVSVPVGTRRHLTETSLGKALILDDGADEWRRLFGRADPEYRKPGWEREMRESNAHGFVVHSRPPPESIRAIAAPVRGASGRIMAAISMVTVAQYLDELEIAKLAPEVRQTADAISRDLGWRSDL